MLQETWYQMMGISKIFLRNLIIGFFILSITTIITLSNLLLRAHDRLEEKDILHKKELLTESAKAFIISEEKNEKYIQLLREAIKNQEATDKEILKLKTNRRK